MWRTLVAITAVLVGCATPGAVGGGGGFFLVDAAADGVADAASQDGGPGDGADDLASGGDGPTDAGPDGAGDARLPDVQAQGPVSAGPCSSDVDAGAEGVALFNAKVKCSESHAAVCK